MADILTDDPKFLPAATQIARAFRTMPLSWRLKPDGETLSVVLVSGPKVQGTAAGVADQALIDQLFPPKPAQPEQIDLADGVNQREASVAGAALAKAPRRTPATKKAAAKKPAAKKTTKSKGSEIPDDAVG